jgi:hypothetical protein
MPRTSADEEPFPHCSGLTACAQSKAVPGQFRGHSTKASEGDGGRRVRVIPGAVTLDFVRTRLFCIVRTLAPADQLPRCVQASLGEFPFQFRKAPAVAMDQTRRLIPE